MTDATDENTFTAVDASIPVTVKIDLTKLLSSVIGEVPHYTGDPDGPDFEPTFLFNEIIQAAANIVASKLMNNAKGYQGMAEKLKEAIDTKLLEMVEVELQKPYQQLDTYGVAKGEATTLREQIGTQIEASLARGMQPSDSYGRDATRGGIKKYIDTQIDVVLKKEFQGAIDQGKKDVLDKIRNNAAEVIAKTIAKPV